MSRYRPRHGARGRERGWLLGEALLLVVATGVAGVALPAADGTAGPRPSSATSADVVQARVAPAVPAGATAASAPAVTTPAPDAAAAPGGAAPLAASAPSRLLVPALGVDTDLVELGLQDDGAMEVPAAGFPAGWYTGAPTPGELGPAVLAGHVDWAGEAGVFAALHELTPGDEVIVVRSDGSTAVFGVTEVAQFDKDAFPTDAVYGDLDHAGLRLITCGGAFDRSARSYVDNVVVFAELVGTRSA